MIIEGYISIGNGCDNEPRINNEPIRSYLEELISDERSHKGVDTGYVKHIDRGRGEKHYFLADCKMSAHYSDKKCSLEDAQKSMLNYLFGDLEGSGHYIGYSTWTIIGFDLDKLTIGGHDPLTGKSGELLECMTEKINDGEPVGNMSAVDVLRIFDDELNNSYTKVEDELFTMVESTMKHLNLISDKSGIELSEIIEDFKHKMNV